MRDKACEIGLATNAGAVPSSQTPVFRCVAPVLEAMRRRTASPWMQGSRPSFTRLTSVLHYPQVFAEILRGLP